MSHLIWFVEVPGYLENQYRRQPTTSFRQLNKDQQCIMGDGASGGSDLVNG